MAFIQKTKSGSYQVKQGNTGKTLSTFSGKDAKKKAEAEVSRLHTKNKPKSSNRGKNAMKRNEKRKKK